MSHSLGGLDACTEFAGILFTENFWTGIERQGLRGSYSVQYLPL